jgi:hypothetical protein
MTPFEVTVLSVTNPVGCYYWRPTSVFAANGLTGNLRAPGKIIPREALV